MFKHGRKLSVRNRVLYDWKMNHDEHECLTGQNMAVRENIGFVSNIVASEAL